MSGITAAGLLIGVVAKMAAPMLAKRWDVGPAIAVLTFIGVALMR